MIEKLPDKIGPKERFERFEKLVEIHDAIVIQMRDLEKARKMIDELLSANTVEEAALKKQIGESGNLESEPEVRALMEALGQRRKDTVRNRSSLVQELAALSERKTKILKMITPDGTIH